MKNKVLHILLLMLMMVTIIVPGDITQVVKAPSSLTQIQYAENSALINPIIIGNKTLTESEFDLLSDTQKETIGRISNPNCCLRYCYGINNQKITPSDFKKLEEMRQKDSIDDITVRVASRDTFSLCNEGKELRGISAPTCVWASSTGLWCLFSPLALSIAISIFPIAPHISWGLIGTAGMPYGASAITEAANCIHYRCCTEEEECNLKKKGEK